MASTSSTPAAAEARAIPKQSVRGSWARCLAKVLAVCGFLVIPAAVLVLDGIGRVLAEEERHIYLLTMWSIPSVVSRVLSTVVAIPQMLPSS